MIRLLANGLFISNDTLTAFQKIKYNLHTNLNYFGSFGNGDKKRSPHINKFKFKVKIIHIV